MHVRHAHVKKLFEYMTMHMLYKYQDNKKCT